MLAITPARFPEEKPLVQQLFREYEQWLGIDLCFQFFEGEVASLPNHFAPPLGNIVLARIDKKVAGCIGWHPLSKTIVEVKRLFVRPGFQGQGIGKALLAHAIHSARKTGYAKLWLDSLERLTAARKLYESFDFKQIAPYNDCPLPDFYCMELDLLANPSTA